MVFFHRGAKSVADIAMGGQNPYFSSKSQYYHCSFCPGGGQTPLPISMGAMARFAHLWIRHCLQVYQNANKIETRNIIRHHPNRF